MPDDHLVKIETKLSYQEDLLDQLNSIIIRSDQRNIRIALAKKSGPIIPLINHLKFSQNCILERHLCIDIG